MSEIEQARHEIDNAIDKWLKLQGFTDHEVSDLDYSTMNEELDFYVDELNHRRKE